MKPSAGNALFGRTALLIGLCFSFSAQASIANSSRIHSSTYFSHILQNIIGWTRPGAQSDLLDLLKKAKAELESGGDVNYVAERAVGDSATTTLKFRQEYQGVEVVGNEALVHFDSDGSIHDVSGEPLKEQIDTTPSISLDQALGIVASAAGVRKVDLTDPATIKIFRDTGGNPRLTYHLLTRTTRDYSGQEVYLDAHTGEVVLAFDRAYDVADVASLNSRLAVARLDQLENRQVPEQPNPPSTDQGGGKPALSDNPTIIVYDGNTPKALAHVDPRGFPTGISFKWYVQMLDGKNEVSEPDRSAENAYRNSARVYHYYLSRFNRHSYDNQNGKIVNVVHMGHDMANAFWTNEFKVMGYGDGDGDMMIDLTYGLDVAAHEMTHGVTAHEANLVYSGESGALNESYSDFFGKMVDYHPGDWDIGASIMRGSGKRRAIRNMMNPEEFKQPGSMASKYKRSTSGVCNRMNDNCWVHYNSGIPSHAAALIVEAIGKEKAEQLYYSVLTGRLKATSNFHDARVQTELECEQRWQKGSPECLAVTKAFDTVGM